MEIFYRDKKIEEIFKRFLIINFFLQNDSFIKKITENMEKGENFPLVKKDKEN
jgi:hypothetical protein